MTTLLVHFIAIIAIWSTFEGAERDLGALLETDPSPLRVLFEGAWVSIRVISGLALTLGVLASILGGLA